MSSQYFNRYQFFESDGSFKIVPGIELPFKSTDRFVEYIKGRNRLDKISDEFYQTPVFGWLILLANTSLGSLEFEIPDRSIIRVPFPLLVSLQDYKRKIEEYRLYYGD